jgi:hypothetical protein
VLGIGLAHVVGLVTSALLFGAALYVFSHLIWAIPAVWCAVIAVALAVFASGMLPVSLRGSRLRVPQGWFQLGDVLYSAAFGLGLGSGLLLALSSPGYYMLVAWGLSGAAWAGVWPVFMAFAAGRAVVFAANVIAASKPSGDALKTVERSVAITARFRWPESAALLSLGALLLAMR